MSPDPALIAALLGGVVGLVLAFTLGGEQTLPDEPPAKVRIGVGFDAAPPPPSEP